MTALRPCRDALLILKFQLVGIDYLRVRESKTLLSDSCGIVPYTRGQWINTLPLPPPASLLTGSQ